MNNEHLLKNIEQVIRDGFNKRYTGYCPHLNFSKNVDPINMLHRDNLFVIEEAASSFHKKHRFPQTKIWIEEAFFSSYRIISVPLGQDHFLMIEPFGNDQVGELNLNIPTGIKKTITSPILSKEGLLNLNKIETPLLLLLTPRNSETRLQQIPVKLRQSLENEYRNHPISRLKSSDWKVFKEIDELWAQTDTLGSNPEFFDTQLFCMQEIFIHLGWQEKLEKIYPQNSPFNSSRVVQTLQNRKRSVIQGKLWEEDSRLPGYINAYFGGSADLSGLQSFWEQIHYSAYRRQVQKNIIQNPLQFIAVGLLAIQHSFVWREKYLEILLTALPDPLKPAAKLCFLLKKQCPYFPLGDRIRFSTGNNFVGKQELLLQESGCRLGYSKIKKNSQTYLQLAPDLDLKINQSVRINSRLDKNLIEILPILKQPYSSPPELSTIELEYTGIKLQLPLVWPQIELRWNGLKLKFLRKKERYQLSIAHLDPAKKLFLNGQQIMGKESRQNKVYLPIVKQQDQQQIKALNIHGGQPVKGQPLFFSGWVVDRFGNLQDQINIRYGKASASKLFSLQDEFNETAGVGGSGKSFTVSGRYLAQKEYQINYLAGTRASFLYARPEQLQHQTIVFSDENGLQIKNLFFEYLGILPAIYKLAEYTPSHKGYIFIITEKYNGLEVQIAPGMRIISGIGQDVFLVHPQCLEAVLKARLQPK